MKDLSVLQETESFFLTVINNVSRLRHSLVETDNRIFFFLSSIYLSLQLGMTSFAQLHPKFLKFPKGVFVYLKGWSEIKNTLENESFIHFLYNICCFVFPNKISIENIVFIDKNSIEKCCMLFRNVGYIYCGCSSGLKCDM